MWCGVQVLEDLLCDGPSDKLKLVDDSDRNCTICEELTEVSLQEPSQLVGLLRAASERSRRSRRDKGASAAAAHMVAQLTVEFVDTDGYTKVCRLACTSVCWCAHSPRGCGCNVFPPPPIDRTAGVC